MEGSTSFTGWGIVIFLIILFAIFWGGFGNRGNFGGYGYNYDGASGFSSGFEAYKSICEGQKANITQTATTQYLIEQQANATQAVVNAQANMLATKIDFYEYQNLRDQVAERDRKIMQLESRVYNDAQFNALSSQIANIRCNMLTRPEISGVGVACPNAAILNGLGINSLSGLNGGCGCNGVVI